MLLQMQYVVMLDVSDVLMETFCLPLLSYSCEALSYSKQQLNQLNICWNRAYRKVFKMNDWESVKEVQALCGRPDFMHIYTLNVT